MSDATPHDGWHHEVGRLTLPRQVREREAEYVSQRRESAGVSSDANAPLVGISLSGGGIRAATFALGVLQTLGRTNVLRIADYFCTVSGGGYLGACFTSLMTRAASGHSAEKATAEVIWKRHAGGDIGPGMPLLCTEQVHHLRKHGDFLLLRRGVLSRELLRSIGHLVTGWIGSFGIFLLVLLTAASGFLAYTSGLGGAKLWDDVLKGCVRWQDLSPTNWEGLEIAFILGFLVSLIANIVIAGVRAWCPTASVESGETPEDRQERLLITRYTFAQWIGVPVTLAIASLVGAQTVTNLNLMPTFCLGSFVAATCFYWLCSNSNTWWNKSTRSMYAATVSSSLLFLIGACVLLGVVLFIGWLKTGFGGWLAGIGGVSGLLSRLLSRPIMLPKNSLQQTSTDRFVWALLLHVAFALSVAVFVLSTFTLCIYVLVSSGVTHLYQQIVVGAAALIAFFICGFVINFNRIGIHFFYRDRLAETYLVTEANRGGVLKSVRDDSALLVRDLHSWDHTKATSGPDSLHACQGNPAPYHLILCALNLAGSKDLARKDRKSDHFIFSREYCGSTTTGYVRTADYRGGDTELAMAMTISGAAASSGMGFYTSILQAFALTLFNIRLGYWVVNPRVYDDEVGRVAYSGHAPRPQAWSQELGFRRQLGEHVKSWHERMAFWPVYLCREISLLTTPRSALINLSDGGHTGDNIGLYPLFQRRCKLIIACDGEADPTYGFGSFANAIRQIFIDENVRVFVDFDQLRPINAGGLAKQHYVVGRIMYPPSTRFSIHEDLSNDLDHKDLGASDASSIRKAFRQSQVTLSDSAEVDVKMQGKQWLVKDGTRNFQVDLDKKELRVTDCNDPDSASRVGWLIYLKSSLVGKNEPPAVSSYAAKEEHFPHQTTGDQLFDDDQFEAYRALGEHIAESMLGEARPPGGELTATRLVEWCRSQWRPSRTQLLATFRVNGGDIEKTAAAFDIESSVVTRMLAEAH